MGDIVKTEGIKSELHRANIGKIIFTSRSVPISELKESDFLKTYVLTNKSDLFINVFLGNSITNYMHFIAPELSADELAKSGNYQFMVSEYTEYFEIISRMFFEEKILLEKINLWS